MFNKSSFLPNHRQKCRLKHVLIFLCQILEQPHLGRFVRPHYRVAWSAAPSTGAAAPVAPGGNGDRSTVEGFLGSNIILKM